MDLFDNFGFEDNINNYEKIENIDENEIKVENEVESKRSIKNIWKNPEFKNYIKANKKERDESIKEFLEQVNNAMEKIKTLVIDRFEGNIAVCENRNTR